MDYTRKNAEFISKRSLVYNARRQIINQSLYLKQNHQINIEKIVILFLLFQVLENKESQIDFGSSIGTNIPITSSISVNINNPDQKQDSLTQIEYSFSESNSAQGSLTQIQSQTQSDQYQNSVQQQIDQQTRLLSLQEFKEKEQNTGNINGQIKSNSTLSYQSQINQNNFQGEKKSISHSNKILQHTSHFSQKPSTSNHYNYYHNQHKKLQGLSAPNRLFPVNNLISSSQKVQTSSSSTSSQQSMQKSAKVLRLLKKDLTSFPSSMIDSISTANSIPNINNNTDTNTIDEENNPSKMYESNQVRIDESDILETKIHSWLDQMDVHITCPSSKMHDYFDSVRQNTFWEIQREIFSGEDLDGYPTPSSQSSSLNYLGQITESPNPFTPTPRLERRISGQLTSLLPNCNFLNRRRLTLKLDDKKPKEIEEDRDEWDQD